MIFDDEGMECHRDAARNCWVASEPIRSESRLSWSPALPILLALQAKLWCSRSKFCVGFQASTRAATNINGQLRYFVSFVLNMRSEERRVGKEC